MSSGRPPERGIASDWIKIISSTHVLAAVFRASNDWLNGRLKSKNVHSEIVFCLSMNNNVGSEPKILVFQILFKID